MDAVFLPLAKALDITVELIKLLSCLLIAYPLGALFVQVPTSKPMLRHLFNIFVTIVFFFPIFRLYSAFFQSLGIILVTYIVAKYHKGKSMPWVVFVIVMGYLQVTLYNADRVVDKFSGYTYEKLEIVGPPMILTMKLTTFAWNVYDGRRKVEDLDKWQAAKRITKYPSILEFLGYSLYFHGIFIGPYTDFSEYMELINETPSRNAQVKARVKPGRHLPPGRVRAAFTKMFFGFVYFVAFLLYNGKYNYRMALKPEFLKHGLWMRILMFQLGGPFERAKFYALWSLTEGASILSGRGFTGFNAKGEPQWDGADNINVMQIEFAPNFKSILEAWNMKTHIWLRECVYKRVTPKGKKPDNTSIMITFVTSAFWHGTSSGYYLAFLMGGFTTIAARLARSYIRPLLIPPTSNPSASPFILKRVYDLFGVLLSISILNYAASPIVLLSARESLLTWSRLGWYGHIVVMGGLVFFYGGGTSFFMKVRKGRRIILRPSNKVSAAAAAVTVRNGFSKHCA